MNTSLRSKPTPKLGQVAISSTAKAESITSSSSLPKQQRVQQQQGSLMSWNGNNQTAVGSTRRVSAASSVGQDDEFPMKLSHFIQRRNHQHGSSTSSSSSQSQTLQDKWAKLASLTMDPSIEDVAETLVKKSTTQHEQVEQEQQELPQTLTEAMSDSRPCMIASIDDPFTIVNVNQAWCQAYGYSKDEVLNQNFVKLVGNSQALEDFVLEQLLLTTERTPAQASAPIAHATRDGSLVEESLRVGTLSIGADVSDRYIVCATEMDPSLLTASSTSTHNPNVMLTSLEDPQAWGQSVGLA
eukprot:CAMPEP_0113658852 /NCGR_PEP_ID=MMETSP0017_2-20120614/32004_1 /TAXON_ID=2856 /ORGANISM="Cylindrotheca closterium" /LENGTH=297 /DNA_ID=CAMNT_0000573281 /DNA_START=175 /DNA_END=1067 /DNA_ORIENTATION=- /assembly_acc=CAM_ASM_000147